MKGLPLSARLGCEYMDRGMDRGGGGVGGVGGGGLSLLRDTGLQHLHFLQKGIILLS